MKYATLNENGTPNGFYDEDIHTTIPQCAIEITNEQWLECVSNSGKRKFENGELLEYVEVVTTEQMEVSMVSAVQAHIDSKAQSKGYDSILSATSYAGFPNAFQGEAIALGIWRSSVWETAYAIMGKIQAGEMEMPKTLEEGIAMLPKFEG